MKYCFDIDGTILQTEIIDDKYYVIEENKNIIKHINRLYKGGNLVILYTGRHWNHFEITVEQLQRAGVDYDTLICGKPVADFYIDDKAMRPEELCGGTLI